MFVGGVYIGITLVYNGSIKSVSGDEIIMARPFVPSLQQQSFFDWINTGSGSCVLEAVAGSGKTTTLIEALKLMKGTIFFGAYNK
jgi:hypothetical protein